MDSLSDRYEYWGVPRIANILKILQSYNYRKVFTVAPTFSALVRLQV